MSFTQTTVTSDPAWRPDGFAFAPADVIPDALIMATSTVAGNIEGDAPSLRVAYVDDADATFTAEGVEIDEADPTLAEVLVYTGKITQLIRLSREQWVQTGTSTQLAASVQRAIARRANEAYLAEPAPVGPLVSPPAGLLNIAGIVEGDPVDGDLDAIVDLIAQLEDNGANPSHIIVNPAGWAELRKIKTGTDSAQSLLGAGTTDATRMLLDLPVIVSPAITAGTGLVLDRTAIVSAVGSIKVATSEHQYFSADSIALRCTWRIGWNVVRPDRIGTFILPDNES